MSIYFDPRDAQCKSPFGAVRCGTEVRLRLRADGEAPARVTLLRAHEFADMREETPLMPEDGGFCGTFSAPARGELVWYRFRLEWSGGAVQYLGKNGVHGAPDDAQPWQLTVYESDDAPTWFARGVTYQIFPDRFCRSRRRSVEGLLGQRRLHEHRDELPDWLPDENGNYCSDFFGGDLAGIESKLDYLHALGVTTLYLCPIFEASTNHRYDTADYRRIDPLLGDEDDFRSLCAAAHARGMRVLIDGVFNHTGAKSRYFNADGFYPAPGAAQGSASPYYKWYNFRRFPDEYDAWWGIKNLPAVNELEESYVNFICSDEDSVVKHWLRAGADGWRLDVADELPDRFISHIRAAAQEVTGSETFVLGEVWEDASNKIAYSQRRRYFLGGELHGVMNYPFRTALLHYLLGGRAEDFRETMETLRENYPPFAFYNALNFLSTHDTPRLLTLLGLSRPTPEDKAARAVLRLDEQERRMGLSRLHLAALLLFAFPGSPMIYYGDEVGMEGCEDPFNRAAFPWGQEDRGLQQYFARLGAARKTRAALQSGSIEYLCAEGGVLAFARRTADDVCIAAANAGEQPVTLTLPWDKTLARELLTGQQFFADGGVLHLRLDPREGVLLG